jgi:large subunit ribosomal protein L28
MSYRCSICEKAAQAAHNVSHSNRKSRKWQNPNLQRVHVVLDGSRVHTLVCTRCIRTGRVMKAGKGVKHTAAAKSAA